jgi:hypothetical protein
MRVHYSIYPLIFFIFLFSSCSDKVSEIQIKSSSKNLSNIVVSSENHLAFPDIIKYKDEWYVTYRESDAHVHGSFSKIKVIKSLDFLSWEECNTFEIQGYDLRDPKFSFNEITDSLYLHFHVTDEIGTLSANYGTIRSNLYVEYDKIKQKFNDEKLHELQQASGFPNFWLWRPLWHNNVLYVGGYKTGRVNLYKYKGINSKPIIISEITGGGISETTISVFKNQFYFLSRREFDTPFFRLSVDMDSIESINSNILLPILEINILPIRSFGGPNMLVIDSIAYIGGRVSDNFGVPRTMIFRYSFIDKTLEPIITLQSYGDNSYPGMHLMDYFIYGVYYTQNESLNRFEIRSFVINSNE